MTHERKRPVIERPLNKIGILGIYKAALATVLRCPSIYIASFFYYILIFVVMIGLSVALGIAWVSLAISVPLFINIYAGLRFFFGITLALALTWAAMLGFLIVLLKAGWAGMFLKLHQGGRPRLGDFGAGIVRYTWRYMKGYFHIAVLYSIPVIVFYGWLVLQYGRYSSLVFQTRLNYALRAELFRNMDIAWVLVIIFNALVYLLLFVWAESVVLEGSTFQRGYLRSLRFAARNPVRLIVIAAVNYIALAALTEWALRSAMPVLAYDDTTTRYVYSQPPAWPAILSLLLLFILVPILAYVHYALFIPPLPFRPSKRRARTRRERAEVVMADGEPVLAMDETITDRRDDRSEWPISTRRPDIQDILSERRPWEDKHPLLDDSDVEPDGDSLRLNE